MHHARPLNSEAVRGFLHQSFDQQRPIGFAKYGNEYRREDGPDGHQPSRRDFWESTCHPAHKLNGWWRLRHNTAGQTFHRRVAAGTRTTSPKTPTSACGSRGLDTAPRSSNSTTYEEAPARVRPWIRQRTRWFKGWMSPCQAMAISQSLQLFVENFSIAFRLSQRCRNRCKQCARAGLRSASPAAAYWKTKRSQNWRVNFLPCRHTIH